MDGVNAPKPDERFSRAELRYRIADAINDRLRAIPYLHATAKAAVEWLERRKDRKRDRRRTARDCPQRWSLGEGAKKWRREPSRWTRCRSRRWRCADWWDPSNQAFTTIPAARLCIRGWRLTPTKSVLDFGCGCGRVARQLILQRPSPTTYVGIDLHAGMIEWCQRNLTPAAPNFNFYHHDVFNVAFNPGHEKPLSAPFPVGDSQITLVNALSVFTHLTQDQAEYYLRECARVLQPEGVLHASWFLFDKSDHPMMDETHNALYVSYADPSAAVIFDRAWLQNTTRALGLRIFKVIPPEIRGHQWLVLMTPRSDVAAVDLPPDTAPRGIDRFPSHRPRSSRPELVLLVRPMRSDATCISRPATAA